MRRSAIARRDALAPAERARASAAIAARLGAMPRFGAARRIGLFATIGSEVETAPIEAAARARNARTFYPRIEGNGLAFFAAWRDELSPEGAWRIPQPPPDDERRADVASIDLFVVPGVAFDARRHRLGYGRGYYDRLLVRAPQAATFGVAFETQVLADLPSEPHDVPVDIVVTESRLF